LSAAAEDRHLADDLTTEKVRKHLKGVAKLPWEVDMPPEKAAKTLGTYLGMPALEPAAVLDLNKDTLTHILEETTIKGNKELEKALFSHADAVTNRFFGPEVYFRGIVEFSNVCANDCGYCGIRKHHKVRRYTMPIEEVVEVAKWSFDNGMGTLMLQSGELPTKERMKYLLELVPRVREATVEMDLQHRGLTTQDTSEEQRSLMGLAVALSVGELPEEDYMLLKDAGARRYLLRIETSNPELYRSLHPADMSWEQRVECLKSLKRVGMMVGSGVMVGLPGQILGDLAGDLVFFKEMGIHMVGMGPYITEEGTPVAEMWKALYGHLDKKQHMKDMFELTTRMNALARVTIGNCNISATTALQAIEPNGREVALRRGCNVLMPILTPTKYREHYQLYEGKPCITDTADECRKCLNARVSMIGKKLKPHVWADPQNFIAPVIGVQVPAAVSGVARGYVTSSSSRGYAGSSSSRGSATSSSSRAYATSSSIRGYATSSSSRGYATSSSSGRQQQGLHSSASPGAADAMLQERPPAATAAAAAHGKVAGGPGLAAFMPGSDKGSDVPRVNVGVFGIMNAGKSTLMNAITRQETSIVDATPGTTADVKAALMELHDIGPCKLFDTAGVDEAGELGAKKRKKALSTLKETDVALIVVDIAKQAQAAAAAGEQELQQGLKWELELLAKAEQHGVVPLLVLNLKGSQGADPAVRQRVRGVLDPEQEVLTLELDLGGAAAAGKVPDIVAGFLQEGVTRSRKRPTTRSLPDWSLTPQSRVFLNIPMDAETPSMRLLRPQALVQEEAIRHWASTTAYRMDLAAARSGDPAQVAGEKARFMASLESLLNYDGPKLLVTDSQAMDIVHPWTLDDAGNPLLPITTFSIAMIHRQSGGKLPLFIKGIEAFARGLEPDSSVLIAEACNHNRITDNCNDIGMVQIPDKLQKIVGPNVKIEHAFGREYPDEKDLSKYQLALHCGGCMIDPQKMRARISDMEEAGIPVTNYGLFLSYVHSPHALARALEPWGLTLPL